MRRTIVALSLLAVVLSAAPSRAVTTTVVVTQGSIFIPGDDSFTVPTLHHPAGNEMLYGNLDLLAGHSFTSVKCRKNGGIVNSDPLNFACPTGATRLFDSGAAKSFGESGPVNGVATTPAGSWRFFCIIHVGMLGTLVVV